MFDRPHLLWLLVLAPLAATPGILAMRSGLRAAGAASATLRALCVVALVAMLAGLRIPGRIAAQSVAVVAVMDESRSVSPDQQDWMRRQIANLKTAMAPNDQLGIVGFGRDARLLAPLTDPRLLGNFGDGIDGGATNIASALTAAESLFAPEADKRIVLLSDGNETEDSAMTEVPAMLEDGVRIFAAAPPPSATERIAVTNFYSPDTVRSDQRFAFRIGVESESQSPVAATLKLYRDDTAVGGESIVLRPGMNDFELPYRLEQPGAYLMSAEVSIAPPRVALNTRVEAPISVTGAPRILIVSNSMPESLVTALKLRNYKIDFVSPRSLSEHPADYLPYQLVILDDVPAGSLTPASQHALNRYVADYGGGLVATGDTLREESLAGGDLEKALPVKFVPQPPPPSREPIAVYLCIDRSNSMSYDSRYPAVRDGERIRYAKQAAIALLRQLDDTDFAGVIAFDSQPYVLAHLQQLGDDRTELENRIDRLQPGGGTDFKDALEIAEREILQSNIPVRQVILLTDGDTNRQYHDHDDLIAEFARQHIPVSTIRIGPDLANLELLQDFANATGGIFYRVQDIEKLPLLLVGLTREAMNRRKSDRTTVAAGEPSAMLSGIGIKDIPPIDFFAATEAKDGAQVTLKVERADKTAPLLASWQYGLGRAAIFAGDPDSLATLSWIRWNRYVEFWSQLANWTMRQGDSGAFTTRVHSAPDGSIAVEAEKADPDPVSNLVCRITGPGRAIDVAMTEAGASIYRGEVGPLPRGKYVATLMFKAGDSEKVIEQREFATAGSIPADSAELRIKPPNLELLRRLSAATHGAFDATPAIIARHTGQTVAFRRSADQWLIPLVIMLFLGEVFVRRRYLGD
ncbi:VWA domain-containing protein [Candidatus Binatus sp.]|uniref:VWA domain-containing protein n=1 Tax=Candidatus Binatus sp. TaxID=2811406 RepID=UPI003C3B891B